MARRPRIEDVARAAGVSTATVSRVLNTPDLVKTETRDRVGAAVDALGYAPHFGGRALASNRTDTVGAVIPTMENAIFARGLQAVQERLAEAGVTLLVATSGYDPEHEARQIRALLQRGVDGLILIGEERDPALHDLMARRGVPFALVWTWRADCPWPSIGFDNAAAAGAMAARAAALGHRRIAMIAGRTAGNDRARARVAGVRAALAARGLDQPPPMIREAAYALEDGARAARELMAADPAPTVILCGNDVLAAGAMGALRELGVEVPAEVSVTGFDDIDLAGAVHPGLTTVHVPHHRMGRAAAEAILTARAGGILASRCFETAIVERASLTPPPAKG